MTILCIETSTSVCSAAICKDGVPCKQCICLEGSNHARLLPRYIETLLSFAREQNLHIDAVALSEGPGSYTGLRIGASTAKGLCYGLNVPLIPVSTLAVLCEAAKTRLNSNSPKDGLTSNSEAVLIPMIDARRMEVYTAAYTPALDAVVEPQAMILDEHSFEAQLEQGYTLVLMGNGSDKARQVLSRDGVRFIEGIKPVAVDMLALAEKAYCEGNFIDVAYSTPLYLKEFQVTKPKNPVLNL